MKTDRVIFLSVPGLRPGDVSERTPTLAKWVGGGGMARLVPTFPCVTSSVQASMWTGRPPGEHGVIANGFYLRDRGDVEFWVGRNDVVQGEQIWEALAAKGITSASWHAQNIKDAAADYIVTPAPIHKDDGSMQLWCYSKPDGLYQQMLDEIGHFPLQHYWGPLAGIQSTQWILQAARWLIERHDPKFHYIYIPHLDYAAQKHGPDSPQAVAALAELDHELAGFNAFLGEQAGDDDTIIVVASEYALTQVHGVVHPNRLLRDAGMLHLDVNNSTEWLVPGKSDAFAMVDHQFAHVYCRTPDVAKGAAAAFEGVPGVAGVYVGADRAEIGMAHERCGEVVLIAEPDHWFSYYWWLDDAAAPPFARTVDIHAKPGYDPVELFFDPATKSIPLDATLVKGSHGAPAKRADQHGALIWSRPTHLQSDTTHRDTDMKDVVLQLFGIA